MALSLQGFAVAKNLSESVLDEQVLSILAGAPIGTDIQLLFNNTKNTSTLTVTGANISGSTITFPNAYAVFTNKTQLTINGDTYYVKNSNGLTQFQLSTLADLSNTVTSPPTGTYIRSDEVTQDNLSNYSAVRREAGPTYTSNDNQLGGPNTNQDYTVDIYNITPKNLLASIDANIDAYNFKVGGSLSKTSNFSGSKSLVSTGLVIIKDPDNINNTLGFSNTSPGLFIYDKQSSSVIRAFSSNQNPWEAVTVSSTLAIVNYISTGTTTITGTLLSTAGYAVGNTITITGAVGTEQAKLNGTWTIASVPTTTTFTFVVSSAPAAATYSSSIGTTTIGVGYLQTTSSDITVGKLVLANSVTGVSIQLKNSTIKTAVSATNTKATFNYKLPVTINNEIYYLCLSS